MKMIATLASRMIDRSEAELGEDLTYARQIARVSPAGFWKLALQLLLIRHQGTTSDHLVHLARLGAVQVEDCGPCVQTAVNLLRQTVISPTLIRAALDEGAGLPQLELDAYYFGRAVAGEGVIDDELRKRLEEAIGERGIVDLTIAAAAVRIFPALKRGLGYARSCSEVEVLG
jgi:hypothetical protein